MLITLPAKSAMQNGMVEADRIGFAPPNKRGQVLEHEGLREMNAEWSALSTLDEKPVGPRRHDEADRTVLAAQLDAIGHSD
ncbi:MAG: hypothetical protein K2Y02_00880 [Burkholderiaceae bacterium]|nr:hypothetical protein [Burkholderiaceae bacterium]